MQEKILRNPFYCIYHKYKQGQEFISLSHIVLTNLFNKKL